MTKIEELKAAFEAATPKATWYYDNDLSAVVYISGHTVKAAADFGKIDGSEKFGTFIALAHNLMPQLLEAVEALEYMTALCAEDAMDWASLINSVCISKRILEELSK